MKIQLRDNLYYDLTWFIGGFEVLEIMISSLFTKLWLYKSFPRNIDINDSLPKNCRLLNIIIYTCNLTLIIIIFINAIRFSINYIYFNDTHTMKMNFEIIAVFWKFTLMYLSCFIRISNFRAVKLLSYKII